VFKNTLFVITFDEDSTFAGLFDFKRNRIYTALIGPHITPATTDDTYYNHYSQIATLVNEWNLFDDLGITATPFKFDY
jgi:acid phosphatase